MNKNLFTLFEISLSIIVFILAIGILTDWHNDLESVISAMESKDEKELEIVQNSFNNMDIQTKKPDVSSGRILQSLICSDVIARNKKYYGDMEFSDRKEKISDTRIWLDFEQLYADEMDEILTVEEGDYHMEYICNSNHEIVEIRVERK